MSRSPTSGGAPARRAVVRWTSRLLRREWRQHLVIVALVAIAVATTVFLSSAAYNLAPAEGVSEFGDAEQFLLHEPDRDATPLVEWIAAGREAFGTIDTIGNRTVAVPGSAHSIEYRSQSIDGAFSDPLLDLLDGVAPVGGDQAAVTDGVAALLSVSVGDSIALDGVERRIVGVVENPSALDEEFVLLPATELGAATSTKMLVDADEASIERFRDRIGMVRVGERSDVPEDVLAGVLMLLACSILLLLVALVASASFTVIAQRRLPQLGMLSAIGATQRHLRLSMVASGALVGVLAAVVGAVLGAAAWVMGVPVVEVLVSHRIDAWNVPWWIAIAAMLSAVATSTGAAWWPARGMSRIPTVMALSGRTPRPARSDRSAVVAIALVAGGVVALRLGSRFDHRGPDAAETVLLVAGTLLVIVGVLLVSPLVIRSVGSVAGRLPIAGRLALRDLDRYQSRSSAALASIGLALGIPVVIMASTAAAENASPFENLAGDQMMVLPEQFDSPFAADQDGVDAIALGVEELTAAIAPATVVRLDAIVNPAVGADPDIREVLVLGLDLRRDDGWERLANVYAATPELVAALGIDPDSLPDGVATSETGADIYVGPTAHGPPLADATREQVTGTGTMPETYTSLPAALLDPAVAAARGWDVVPSGRWLLEFDNTLDPQQIETARGIAARHGFVVETRESGSRLGEVRLASGLVGMLVALAVLAATVGLIRGESSGDIRTLTATGATRSVRRAITAVTAGTLAALGAALGFATAYIGLYAGGLDHLTPLPWRDLALVAIGTPAIAALAGWLIAGREPAAIARRPLD